MQPVRSKIITGCPISGPYTVSVHVKMSVFGTGCTLSGPTVRVPGKVSGMRTGEEEYVQPVRSQKFLS